MDDHTHGLVDDDEVIILPHDIKRDILGLSVHLDGFGQDKLIGLARQDACLGIGDRLPLLAHVTRRELLGQARPRKCRLLWHGGGKCLIQTLGRVITDHHAQNARRGIFVIKGIAHGRHL